MLDDAAGNVANFATASCDSSVKMNPLLQSLYNIVKQSKVTSESMSISIADNIGIIKDAYDVYGCQKTSDILSEFICNRYNILFDKEFLLSDECVSHEIKIHIDGYLYSTGRSAFSGDLTVFIFGVKNGFDALQSATKNMDIHYSDIVKSDDITSQSNVFSYKEGIRDQYIRTILDPWWEER